MAFDLLVDSGFPVAACSSMRPMYFYALETKATGVVGQVTEGPDGIYTMHVVQGTAGGGILNPEYTCSLNNTTPNPQGPGNSVNVSCIFLSPALGGGMGSSLVTDAVVNVTGPQ